MGAYKGTDIGFTWNSAAIAGVREKDITLSGDPIDISSDDSAGWRELLANKSAQDQIDVKLSGVIKDTTMKADWYAGNRTRPVSFTYPDGSTLTGMGFLASYAEKGAYNDATTFEATVSSSGAWVYTPGS